MPDIMTQADPTEVRVEALPPMARLLLRGDPAVLGPAFGIDLPTLPCRSREGERSALWLGPDEWLLLAPEATDWPEWDGEGGAAVDVGHRQIGFTISGALVEDALAVAAPLDLALAAFPVGACTRTIFGKSEIVLWRREAHAFHIEVWRSFAAYVGALLEEGISGVR